MCRAWFYIYDAKHNWISYFVTDHSTTNVNAHIQITSKIEGTFFSDNLHFTLFFTQNYYMALKYLEYCTWIIWTTAIVLLCCSCYFWNILPNILFCVDIYIYNLIHTGWVNDERIFIFGWTILLIMHSLCPLNVNFNTNKHTNSKDFSHISETQKVLG